MFSARWFQLIVQHFFVGNLSEMWMTSHTCGCGPNANMLMLLVLYIYIYIFFLIFFFYLFIYLFFIGQGQQEKGEAISLTPLYHFHPLHRHLDISHAITAESSPPDIASSRTRTGTFGFRAQVANH